MTSDSFKSALAAHKLIPLGSCAYEGGTLVLIGPDEPEFWDHFTQSPEFSDNAAEPLDRWSDRVITPIAKDCGGEAFFPFGGEPFHPFYTWALNTGRFFTSPIGFLVHETRGLFASFRGAVLLPVPNVQTKGIRPCTACVAPCKSACPVGAFDSGYDVAACKSHINSPAGADCVTQGCRARRVCPVYVGNRPAAQAQFHMEAFQ